MRFTHQPGAQPLAGFTIQRGIHRGGFGEVYYARSDGGKEVALKLLQREQDVELRGVRQCLNLKHPNLVCLFDVRSDEAGEQWVVMEYVNGTSLEDLLASCPTGLPLDEVQQWLSGIASGVTYLHDRGIVHRDLKPANVYRENATVKVGDVGLSKRLGSDRRAAHTQSVGTVYYMAPEVANGQYGPGVDVYSVGVMLYEMLSGQLPFMGETTGEVLMKHLTASPDLNRVPELFRGVVSHALAKDPAQRTASVMQIQHEFEDARAGSHRGPAGARIQVASFNGSRNGTVTATLLETPRTSNGDTRTSRPAVKSPAQAASAYAQYPPETTEAPTPPPAATPTPVPPPKPKPVAQTTTAPSKSTFNWPLLIVIVVGLMLYSPGTMRSWAGLGLMGAAFAGTQALRGRNGRRLNSSLVSVDPRVDVEVWDPRAERQQITADTAASMAIGSVSACLISVGAILASEFLQRRPQTPTPEFMAMFTATSLAGTWLILFANQLQQRSTWVKRNPRKTFLAAGMLLATIASSLHQYLLVDYAQPGRFGSAFRNIGVHSLVDPSTNPTWLGYAVFFGGLLFWRGWSQDMSPRRNRQLSFGRLVTCGFAAWLLTVMFAFPQGPAILWAVTISAAVQLATPLAPPVRRVATRRS